ncbi:HET-domain-containing protein [Polyporus arcularius HHB13444]|uniref:HET-domain-containing protein n=1 Tax=Polyporus arcularius HHB13444 TaxID=1314778 RepID=A0A5C3PIW4_9APHY|nr:HET-domain-containing protein [Polyporus arcularius HHB13444]
MRLLDTSTARFRHIDNANQAPYAILSHVWDHADGEQSLQDILEVHEYTQQTPRDAAVATEACPPALTILSAKIRGCCVFARVNGYRYAWVDTCCIDRTSSAELSEAINSMYEWYSQATICYAFLEDVDDSEDPRGPNSRFRRSKWFKRGWTLQELIAPAEVLFLSREWQILGTKDSLSDVIEEITGIDRDILTHGRSLDSVSVARRMSWAARRETTREEDEAYALMGIFGVHMPTIYGEGRKAFVRLQREILEHCPDQSIFAWGHIFADHTMIKAGFQVYTGPFPTGPFTSRQTWQPVSTPTEDSCLFASSPAAFVDSADITPLPLGIFSQRICLLLSPPHYTVTSYGVHIQLPVLVNSGARMFTLAVLACQDASGHLVALMMHSVADTNQHTIGNRLLLLHRDISPDPHDRLEEGQVDEDDDPSVWQHEGLYYRCTTILPATVPSSRVPQAPSHPGSFAHGPTFLLGDFYIPSHRHLTAISRRESALASIADTDANASVTFSIVGPCQITFPRWLPSQLAQFGYKFLLPKPHRGARHVHSSILTLDWSHWWFRVITLVNDSITVGIHFLLCPHSTSDLPPVHATVAFHGEPDPFHRSAFRQAPSCDVEHVDHWPNASKSFYDCARGTSVRLTFSRGSLGGRDMTDSSSSAGVQSPVYSVLIDVGSLTVTDGTIMPPASSRRPVLLEREWEWKGVDYWTDGQENSSDSDSEAMSDDNGISMVEEHPVNFVSVRFVGDAT